MQLSIRSLTKTYPNGVRALNNINLTINNGLFGLLGPNGAGKSSLMRTIATLQDADTGNIFLDDLNVLEQKEEVKKILGYLPQEFGVYPNITAEELLNHIALLKGIATCILPYCVRNFKSGIPPKENAALNPFEYSLPNNALVPPVLCPTT